MEPTVEWIKLNINSTNWNKEEKSIQSEYQEEIRILKSEDRIISLRDIFKRINIPLITMPEGEEQEQETENLFGKKKRERKLPLFGEGNRHTSPGSTQNSKQDGCKQDHTRTHHN